MGAAEDKEAAPDEGGVYAFFSDLFHDDPNSGPIDSLSNAFQEGVSNLTGAVNTAASNVSEGFGDAQRKVAKPIGRGIGIAIVAAVLVTGGIIFFKVAK